MDRQAGQPPFPMTVQDALRDLIQAVEFTPLGVRGIKAVQRAKEALRVPNTLEGNVAEARNLFQEKLAQALRANPQDAPAFLDQAEAAVWHQAQASALQWVLEMIG